MEITVREFIRQLSLENQDLPIYFGGLDFYRLKDRGGCLQVEFNQTVDKDENSLVYILNHTLSYITAVDRNGNVSRYDIREEHLYPDTDCPLEGTRYTIFDPKSPAIGFDLEIITRNGEYFIKHVNNNGVPGVSGKGILKSALKALSAILKKDIYSSTNSADKKFYASEGLVPEMMQVWKKWKDNLENVEYDGKRDRYVFKYTR